VNAGTGVPPATLAEFNFNGGGTDFFDVLLMDGYNLPCVSPPPCNFD
jgi:hypothetical protein